MVLGEMGGATGAFRGEIYASSEGIWEKEGVGFEMLTYEEDEMERLRSAVLDENGLLNDTPLFLNIFGENEIDGSLRGLGEFCFKISLLSEGIGYSLL